jgi:hypothetical protein
MAKQKSSIKRVISQFKGVDIANIARIQSENDANVIRTILNKPNLSDSTVKGYQRLANQYIKLFSTPKKNEVKLVKGIYKEDIGVSYETNLVKFENVNLTNEQKVAFILQSNVSTHKNKKYFTPKVVSSYQMGYSEANLVLIEKLSLYLHGLGFDKAIIQIKFKTNSINPVYIQSKSELTQNATNLAKFLFHSNSYNNMDYQDELVREIDEVRIILV